MPALPFTTSPPPDESPAESPEKTVTGDSPFRRIPMACTLFTQPSRTPNLHHREESPVSVVISFINTTCHTMTTQCRDGKSHYRTHAQNSRFIAGFPLFSLQTPV